MTRNGSKWELANQIWAELSLSQKIGTTRSVLVSPEIIAEKTPELPFRPFLTEQAVEKVPSLLSTQFFCFDFLDMFRSQDLTKTMQRMAWAFVCGSVSSIARNAIVSIQRMARGMAVRPCLNVQIESVHRIWLMTDSVDISCFGS